MAIYLLDYENIQDISLIREIKSGDRLVVIYTGAAGIKLRQLEHLKNIGVEVEYLEVSPGSNALDFQLDVYLGYLIGNAADNRYVIVSNDGGYKFAADMASKLGASVSQLTSKLPKQQPKKNELPAVQAEQLPEKILPKQLRQEAEPAEHANKASLFKRLKAALVD